MEFIDLKSQYIALKDEIDSNIHSVLDSGQYMMGNYIHVLEKKLADYVGVNYCITCANGTDALQLALMTWDVKAGDAVFVPSFTFYATAEVVSFMGATPIFVDCDAKTFNIDTKKLEIAIQEVVNKKKLTPKVIIPVDLFGQPANYSVIRKIADKYDLFILEDGAQGFGGQIGDQKACSFGDISTTSFFPAKPLGCYGDGGAIFTNNKSYYEILLSLRVHGQGKFKYDNVRVGLNSRLDTLQAAILLPKLEAFANYELIRRNNCATYYSENLADIVKVPSIPKNYISSWAQYTILLKNKRERDYLQIKLKESNIPSMIYYPIPLHKQSIYKDNELYGDKLDVSETISDLCLSLPMHPYLSKEEMKDVVVRIKRHLKEIRYED